MKKIYTVDEIKKMYEDFNSLTLDAKEKRTRGYELEKIIFSILSHENLEPISSYKEAGEQIDGSFFWTGQTFLLEAKWHKDPLPVSSVYSFKGKVDGKFHTSSGIFISISGFGDDVREALRFGKVQNIILFDKTDLDYIIIHKMNFTEVLKFKLRHAGDTGNPYEPYKVKSDIRELLSKPPIFSHSNINSRVDYGIDVGYPGSPMFIIFCEGRNDYEAIEKLFSLIYFHRKIAFQIKALHGAYNLINTITSIGDVINKTLHKFDVKGIVVFLDEDEAGVNSRMKFEALENDFIAKNSIPTSVKIMNVDAIKIEQVVNSKLQISRYPNWLREVTSFVNNQLTEYIDLESEEAKKAIETELARAKWNIIDKNVELPAQDKSTGRRIFNNIDKLRGYLDEVADNAADSVAIWDKEAEHDYDFSDLIYECILKYKNEIAQLGWEL